MFHEHRIWKVISQIIEGIWLSQYALREKPFKTSVPERTTGPVYSGQSPYPDVDAMLPSEHLPPRVDTRTFLTPAPTYWQPTTEAISTALPSWQPSVCIFAT